MAHATLLVILFRMFCLVELSGLEPLTPCLQSTPRRIGMVHDVHPGPCLVQIRPAWFVLVATEVSYRRPVCDLEIQRIASRHRQRLHQNQRQRSYRGCI